MTNAWLSRFDKVAHRAFKGSGLADLATYTGPADEAVEVADVRVYVNRGTEVMGDNQTVVFRKTTAKVLRADVDLPEVMGKLVIGTETWWLESKLSEDEGMTQWVLNEQNPEEVGNGI